MKVQVLFDTRGKVHALFHPSPDADAPRLEFHPARGLRAAWLELPAGLEGLPPGELHVAVAVKRLKLGPQLVERRR
jgi:hypothetical protein